MGKLFLGTQEICPLIYDIGSVSIDGIPREVDEHNFYGSPSTGSITFTLPSGIEGMYDYALAYAFYQSQAIVAADLRGIDVLNNSGSYAFSYAFSGCESLETVDASNVTEIITQPYCFRYAFKECISLVSVDFSSLETIQAVHCFNSAFQGDTALVTVDFSSLVTADGTQVLNHMFDSCESLTTLNLGALETLTGQYAARSLCAYCSSLTTVNLSSLSNIGSASVFSNAFQECTSLATLSFPSLTANSFGGYNSQFNNMLAGVTGCTVHFPAAIQSTIGSWASVTNGFGGTNTTVLFDL